MSVMVDDSPLSIRELGLNTVGDVLTHVASDDRLIVQVLIDGTVPDLSQLDRVKQTRLDDCTLFVETARPRVIAHEALDVVEESLAQAEKLRTESAELFRTGDAAGAMQKLSGCFGIWNNAQDSLGKVAKLLRIDLARVEAGKGMTAKGVVEAFAGHLRQLRDALEARDYVLCCDVLTYEMETVAQDWQATIKALRKIVGT
jgi:hypothetical protein